MSFRLLRPHSEGHVTLLTNVGTHKVLYSRRSDGPGLPTTAAPAPIVAGVIAMLPAGGAL